MTVSTNPVHHLSIISAPMMTMDSVFIPAPEIMNIPSIIIAVHHLAKKTMDKMVDKLSGCFKREIKPLSIVYYLSLTNKEKNNKKKECACARAMMDTPPIERLP